MSQSICQMQKRIIFSLSIDFVPIKVYNLTIPKKGGDRVRDAIINILEAVIAGLILEILKKVADHLDR